MTADPRIAADRAELAVALGKAIARERWCKLPATLTLADRLREEIEYLELDAYNRYWFEEKPPSTADIQHDRGRRFEKNALAEEIANGCAGKLVEAALAKIDEYEAALYGKGPLIYPARPDYLAAATRYADAVTGDAEPEIDFGPDEKTLVTRKKK